VNQIRAREIVATWVQEYVDDFTQECIGRRFDPLVEAITTALKEAERERDEAQRSETAALKVAIAECKRADAAETQFTRVREALATKCGADCLGACHHIWEPLAEPATPREGRAWETDRQDGQVTEHSMVIGGVLCRWWGEQEPPGAQILARLLPTTPREHWRDLGVMPG
jgi:hypothetical protein